MEFKKATMVSRLNTKVEYKAIVNTKSCYFYQILYQKFSMIILEQYILQQSNFSCSYKIYEN